MTEEVKQEAASKTDRELLEEVWHKVGVQEGRCAERALHCPGILAAQANGGNGNGVVIGAKDLRAAIRWAGPRTAKMLFYATMAAGLLWLGGKPLLRNIIYRVMQDNTPAVAVVEKEAPK